MGFNKKEMVLIGIGGIIISFLTLMQIVGKMSSNVFLNVILCVLVIYVLVVWLLKNHKEIAKPKEIFKKDNELNTKRVVCTALIILIFLGSAIPIITYNLEKAAAAENQPDYVAPTPSPVETNTSEEKTADSLTPEEEFMQTYDTNGDNLLDANEFPYSKLVELNDKDKQNMGSYYMPYRTIQELIDDFDADYDKKLSVTEVKNFLETLSY